MSYDEDRGWDAYDRERMSRDQADERDYRARAAAEQAEADGVIFRGGLTGLRAVHPWVFSEPDETRAGDDAYTALRREGVEPEPVDMPAWIAS